MRLWRDGGMLGWRREIKSKMLKQPSRRGPFFCWSKKRDEKKLLALAWPLSH